MLQVKLCFCKRLREGKVIQKNILEAIRWLSLAAEQGDNSARAELGLIYIGDEGFQNYKNAKELFLLAAEQGELRAMAGLGMLYGSGLGVPPDPIRAYMWFNVLIPFSSMTDGSNLLSQDGFNEARSMRSKLTKIMSYDQINEAQELSMQCLKNHFKNC